MVADFIEEYGGYLKIDNDDTIIAGAPREEARKAIEYGANRDGYWTRDKFLEHVQKAVDIAERKYSRDQYTFLWIFDQR